MGIMFSFRPILHKNISKNIPYEKVDLTKNLRLSIVQPKSRNEKYMQNTHITVIIVIKQFKIFMFYRIRFSFSLLSDTNYVLNYSKIDRVKY